MWAARYVRKSDTKHLAAAELGAVAVGGAEAEDDAHIARERRYELYAGTVAYGSFSPPHCQQK